MKSLFSSMPLLGIGLLSNAFAQRVIVNPTPGDYENFGFAVACHDSGILIGTPFDNTGADDAGAVFLFNKNESNISKMFLAQTPASHDLFGAAVAVSDQFVLIGAQGTSQGAEHAGAAYLFDRITSKFLHRLQKPTPLAQDNFGLSVAILDDNILVGAPGDDTGATNAGAVYVFDGVNGKLLQTIANPEPGVGDMFGWAIAVTDAAIIAGAPLDDTGAEDAGSAYVFNRTTGALIWKLHNPTPEYDDEFGYSTATRGDDFLVGAPFDDNPASDGGSVYLVDHATGTILHTFTKPLPAENDFFGYALATNGNTIIIGAPSDDLGAQDAGAVYRFDNITRALREILTNPTPETGDSFGYAVAIAAHRIIVGMPFDDQGADDAGSAVVFAFAPCQVELLAPVSACGDSVTITGIATFETDFIPAQRTGLINGIPVSFIGDTLFATIPVISGNNRVIATCNFVDSFGGEATASDSLFVFADKTPPSGSINFSEFPRATGEARDDESGVDTIDVITAQNCAVALPPFRSGERLVQFSISALDSNLACRVSLKIKNRSGCESVYDTGVIAPPRRLPLQLTILTPENGAKICSDSVTVIALANFGGLAPAEAVGRINGLPVEFAGDSLITTLELRAGSTTIVATCFFIDELGDTTTVQDSVTVKSDATPPVCTLNFDNLPIITGEARDDESGIARVDIYYRHNCTIRIEPFQRGANLVRFSVEPDDPSEPAGFLLRILNKVDCETLCDPVALTLRSQTEDQHFTLKLPHTDHYLLVRNHGVERIRLRVNKQEINLITQQIIEPLGENAFIMPFSGDFTMDLSRYFFDGENHVTLTCFGPVASYAEILFLDMEVRQPTFPGNETSGQESLPKRLVLHQNYPNPFNAGTVIIFEVSGQWAWPLSLQIFDMRGALVKTLAQGNFPPGQHAFSWPGDDDFGKAIASGAYFYKIISGNFVAVRKLLLTK